MYNQIAYAFITMQICAHSFLLLCMKVEIHLTKKQRRIYRNREEVKQNNSNKKKNNDLK